MDQATIARETSRSLEYELSKAKREMMEMARRAASEISDLRRTIERLKPKADAYDKLSIVLGMMPQPSRDYGEDLAGRLYKRAEELAAELLPPAATTEPQSAE